MLSDVTALDVILGLDWLASCYVILNYHFGAVKFNILGESAFMFQGNQNDVPCNLISMLRAQWWLG